MRKKLLFLILPALMFSPAMTNEKEAFEIYNSKGKESSYEKMLENAKDADVVFFGELHDNAVGHWLEYELAHDLAKEKQGLLTLGAEMFESDGQDLLNEYISGKINKKQFEDQARLWKNHATDYAPLLQVAVDNKLKFIATNVPRRYASLVNSKGFTILDSLDASAKKCFAPLPIEYDPNVPCYKKMLEMSAGHGMKANVNLPKAQALKDATMAYFIVQNFEIGKTFLHFNGSYHSDNYEGIIWYLKKMKPELKIMTITTVEQKNIEKMEVEHENKADFVIVTNSNFTKTYK